MSNAAVEVRMVEREEELSVICIEVVEFREREEIRILRSGVNDEE